MDLQVCGSMLALWVTGTTLNISSFMGAIMVVGIVHKNGILMLDSEQYFTERGLGLREAIFNAGRRRLSRLGTISTRNPSSLVATWSELVSPTRMAALALRCGKARHANWSIVFSRHWPCRPHRPCAG